MFSIFVRVLTYHNGNLFVGYNCLGFDVAGVIVSEFVNRTCVEFI